MGNDGTTKKEYQDTYVLMNISYGNFLLGPTTWKDHIREKQRVKHLEKETPSNHEEKFEPLKFWATKKMAEKPNENSKVQIWICELWGLV